MLLTPAPSNLRAAPGAVVESDVFNICERIKEISPRLTVRVIEGADAPFVVSETGSDGVERFVARYEELDARILENLRYMAAVPFEDRVRKLEREIEASNTEALRMPGDRFEEFAYDVQKALVESNITDPKHFKSYRKVPQ